MVNPYMKIINFFFPPVSEMAKSVSRSLTEDHKDWIKGSGFAKNAKTNINLYVNQGGWSEIAFNSNRDFFSKKEKRLIWEAYKESIRLTIEYNLRKSKNANTN